MTITDITVKKIPAQVGDATLTVRSPSMLILNTDPTKVPEAVTVGRFVSRFPSCSSGVVWITCECHLYLTEKSKQEIKMVNSTNPIKSLLCVSYAKQLLFLTNGFIHLSFYI